MARRRGRIIDPGPEPSARTAEIHPIGDRVLHAVFYNGRQISKGHSTAGTALIEAYEMGAVLRRGIERGDLPALTMLRGYTIQGGPGVVLERPVR